MRTKIWLAYVMRPFRSVLLTMNSSASKRRSTPGNSLGSFIVPSLLPLPDNGGIDVPSFMTTTLLCLRLNTPHLVLIPLFGYKRCEILWHSRTKYALSQGPSLPARRIRRDGCSTPDRFCKTKSTCHTGSQPRGKRLRREHGIQERRSMG